MDEKLLDYRMVCIPLFYLLHVRQLLAAHVTSDRVYMMIIYVLSQYAPIIYSLSGCIIVRYSICYRVLVIKQEYYVYNT